VRRDTEPQSPVVVVAGPTASGKSALALELAAARGGTIINADSQQIYRDLSILSARPDAASMRRVPHRLYGFLDAAERGSVALWRERALAEIAAAHQAGSLPFLVGGTGLYLRALQRGLASVPGIPASIRDEAAALYAEIGADDLWPAVERRRGYSIHVIRGGKSDHVSDADARRLTAAGCRVDTLEDASHFLHVDRPEELLDRIVQGLA